MNDSTGIKKVGDIINEPNISSGCTTLVYFLETEKTILDASDGYFCELFLAKNDVYPARILVDDATTQQSLPEDQRLKVSKGPSSQKQNSKQAPTTFTSSIQVANNCEKYGEDWLNLFIQENAVPGSTVQLTTNPDNTKTLSSVNQNGIVTSVVNVPQDCTFVPPPSSSGQSQISVPVPVPVPTILQLTEENLKIVSPNSPPDSASGSPSASPKADSVKSDETFNSNGTLVQKEKENQVASPTSTAEEAQLGSPVVPPQQDDENTIKQQLLDNIKNDNLTIYGSLKDSKVREALQNAQIGNIIISDKIMDEPIPYESKTIVIYNNEPYMVYKNKDNTKGLIKIKDATLFTERSDKTLKKKESKKNGNTTYPRFDTKNSIDGGGTRRKRNKNTNGGKRTRKGKRKGNLRKTRKGKRTRKLIRHKNKLKTNKLRTRKLKLNTNKLRTRKA